VKDARFCKLVDRLDSIVAMWESLEEIANAALSSERRFSFLPEDKLAIELSLLLLAWNR
jgi:hypothetical protein